MPENVYDSQNILIEKNMPQNESASFSVSEFGWVPHFQLRFTARSLAAICFLSTSSILPPLSIAADGNFYDGGEIYETHCMRCHGVNLGGGYTKSLVDGIWQFGKNSWNIRQNIRFGITDLGMPPFENILSREEIGAVVNFLRAKEEAARVERPQPPPVLYTQNYQLKVEILTEELEIPWSVDFIDSERLLVTEKPGTLRIFHGAKLLPDAVTGTPSVLHWGQGGLMDVAVDPEYIENGWIYLSYTHQLRDIQIEQTSPLSMTRIVRGRLHQNAWKDEEVLYEAPHESYTTGRVHYGSRIVFGPEGHLYFSIGDRGEPEHAQELDRPNGKVHRVQRDGGIPLDNPFIHLKGALPSIYSYGHRNPQGLAVLPETGRVWNTEHGPLGGDELNVIFPGSNYGWPEITYGRNYDGTIITENTSRPEMEQPVIYWSPSIAVCGLNFYRGDLFPKWNGKLLAGALKYEEIQLLTIENDRVMHREVIVKNLGRVRDVAMGPDGAIYVVLNGPDMLLRLTPDTPIPEGYFPD